MTQIKDIKILRNAISILWKFVLEKNQWGPRELARSLGLPKSSVLRIMQTLCNEGFLFQADDEGKYAIGSELKRMGTILNSQDSFLSVAIPVLKKNLPEINENMYVFTYDNDKVVVDAEVECTHPLRLHLEIGVPYDIHRGATGKTILGNISQTKSETIFNKLENNSDVDISRLKRQIKEGHKNGYFFSEGERIEGVVGFAAPIFGAGHVLIGGIAIMVPQIRYSKEKHKLCVDVIKKCSHNISSRLGDI